MPSRKELSVITFEHVTEACPQMTRRFCTGPAVEFSAWLLMHRTRIGELYKRLPKNPDPEMKAWADGMAAMYLSRLKTINWLLDSMPDRFPQTEWSSACATVDHWIKHEGVDPSCSEAATDLLPDVRETVPDAPPGEQLRPGVSIGPGERPQRRDRDGFGGGGTLPDGEVPES